MHFTEKLQERLLFLDGATGSMLQGCGLKPGETPARLNSTHKSAVVEVHRRYVEAGADIITANTFGVYSDCYADAEMLIKAAMENAKEAVQGSEALIALDIGPTGRLLAPLGDMDFETAYGLFAETARIGAACGADLIIVETMTDLYEAKAAILAAQETGLPVIATVSLDERGRTLMGADAACAAALLEGLGVDALGMNCGYGPAVYEKLLPALLQNTHLPVILQPNAGLPVSVDGVSHYALSPDEFAQRMVGMVQMGVRMAGGCCGTTPLHIQAMVQSCRGLAPTRLPIDRRHRVCSGSKAVNFDPEAGRSALSLARCESLDVDNLIDEALELSETVDIVEIFLDKPETVIRVQEIVRTPLSLDASHSEILLAAARLYNGIPLIPAESKALSEAGEGAATLKRLRPYGAVILS